MSDTKSGVTQCCLLSVDAHRLVHDGNYRSCKQQQRQQSGNTDSSTCTSNLCCCLPAQLRFLGIFMPTEVTWSGWCSGLLGFSWGTCSRGLSCTTA
jgi:hypothetical protein